MRREVVVLAVVGLGLSVGSCAKEDPVPAPQCPEGQVCMVPPRLAGDEVSGCDDRDHGATLVKIKITLEENDKGGCYVESVQPDRVCVAQGGAIHWKVKSDCDLQPDPAGVLAITEVDWVECIPKWPVIERGPNGKNHLLCGVPENQGLEEYKYGVDGDKVEGMDPWIEVRRGG